MEQDQPSIQQNKRPGLARMGMLLAIIILILFLGLFYIKRGQSNKNLSNEKNIPKVQVIQVKPITKPIEIMLPSSAQAWHITPVWSRVNGYLLRYLVDIGDRVKQGQLLAEIDTPEADDAVLQAEADLKNAQAENNIAKITTDRWQRLWQKNPEAVSKQEVDQYASNYQSAQSVVVANEKNLSRLTQQQQFKFIYAPFDGVITQRNIDIGSLIYGTVNGMSQELFEIAQTDWIRFFIDVPQNYFRQIQEDLQAEVTVKEYPGKIFKGKVARYAKALDPTARTLLTQVNVENDENLLYAGLYAQVKLMVPHDNPVFNIPTTAMIIHSSSPHVAVVDQNSQVQLKQIKIGRDYGKNLEITHGLEENDKVITNPSDRIKEGVKVEIIDPPT